jgi:ABC-type Fe3+ transport system permease subunit
MKKNKYYFMQPRRSTRIVPIVFIGIVGFLIAFPFVAVNLRFQTGYFFSKILDYLGTLCLTVGGLLTAYSILKLFMNSRSMDFKYLIAGVALLWVGCWLTGEVLNILGLNIGNDHTSPGYH